MNNITVKTAIESTILSVFQDATVKNLKDLIHKKLGLKCSEQRLLFGDIFLDNDKDLLQSYGIDDGCVIDVIPIFNIVQARITLPSSHDLTVTVQSNDKVSKLKSLVQDSCGLSPNEQVMLYNGEEIADDTILASRKISGSCNFVVILKKITDDKSIILRVEDDELCTLKLEKETSISELKNRAFKETGYNIANLNIKYKNRLLKDDDNLESVGVRDAFTSLNVCEVEKIKCAISIILPDGKKLDMSVMPNVNISQFKSKIRDLSGLCMEEHVILYKGEVIEDGMMLSSYRIINGDTLKMIPKQKGPIQLIVKAADNKTFAIKVFRMEKCRDLKEKIQQKFGMNPSDQSLSFHDAILEDDKFLNDYPLSDKSVINLLPKLYGGDGLLK